jgi:methyl-accepting chemotaxis protein
MNTGELSGVDSGGRVASVPEGSGDCIERSAVPRWPDLPAEIARQRKLQLVRASRDAVVASLIGIPLVLAFGNDVDHLRLVAWGLIGLVVVVAGAALYRTLSLLHEQFGQASALRRETERLERDLGSSDGRVQDERTQKVRRRQALEGIAAEFENKLVGILDAVADGTRRMRETADSLTDTAEQTDRRATAVSEAAGQATGNVETVAAAADELASSIREIDRQVALSTAIADTAVEESRHTDDVVRGLAEATQQIGTVVSLITSIAAQTNLLALNATIEAARAGEAGKGFAVVAGEVKALADQTARATKDIVRHIGSVQQRTATAVAAIDRVAATIGEISSITSAIAAAVEQQTAATQQIARNVQQAADGTRRVTDNIHEVSGAANSTRRAAGEVLTAANRLAGESAQVRSEVKEFLTEIKKQDIISIVNSAADLISQIGLEEAKKVFNAEGEFKYGEIYVCVIDFSGIRLCYPPEPEKIGMNVSGAVSEDGKYVVRDIIDIVDRQTEGWTEYMWGHPRKKTHEPKITFSKRVPNQDLIVYVGAYKA